MEPRAPQTLFMQVQFLLMYELWRAGGLMLVGMALYRWGVLTGENPAPPHEALLFFDDKVIDGARAAHWKYYRNADRYYWPVPLDKLNALAGRRVANYKYVDERNGREARLYADHPMLYDLSLDPERGLQRRRKTPRGRTAYARPHRAGSRTISPTPAAGSDMATRNLTLQIDRGRHAVSRVVESDLPPLGEGQVRFRIERFAVTANTVTYATTGDVLGYWDFFPTGEPGWGCVPAMDYGWNGDHQS